MALPLRIHIEPKKVRANSPTLPDVCPSMEEKSEQPSSHAGSRSTTPLPPRAAAAAPPLSDRHRPLAALSRALPAKAVAMEVLPRTAYRTNLMVESKQLLRTGKQGITTPRPQPLAPRTEPHHQLKTSPRRVGVVMAGRQRDRPMSPTIRGFGPKYGSSLERISLPHQSSSGNRAAMDMLMARQLSGLTAEVYAERKLALATDSTETTPRQRDKERAVERERERVQREREGATEKMMSSGMFRCGVLREAGSVSTAGLQGEFGISSERCGRISGRGANELPCELTTCGYGAAYFASERPPSRGTGKADGKAGLSAAAGALVEAGAWWLTPGSSSKARGCLPGNFRPTTR